MKTLLFKTRPERLGKYGRQWVGQNTRRFRGQSFKNESLTFATKSFMSWARKPRKALEMGL